MSDKILVINVNRGDFLIMSIEDLLENELSRVILNSLKRSTHIFTEVKLSNSYKEQIAKLTKAAIIQNSNIVRTFCKITGDSELSKDLNNDLVKSVSGAIILDNAVNLAEKIDKQLEAQYVR